MRKTGVILAGAVCFDLGILIVSSQAAVDMYLKVDAVNTAARCVQKGGTVVDKNSQKFCKTTKKGTRAPKN